MIPHPRPRDSGPSRRRRGSAPRLAAVAAGLLAACSPPAEHALATRFIEDDPEVLLDRGRLFDEETVFAWEFASAADLEPWKLRDVDASWRRGPLRLRPSSDDPSMERRVDLETRDLHALEVELAGLAAGRLELLWAGPEESFSSLRHMTRASPPRQRGRRRVYRFDLAAHPSWRGRVTRLRLDPTGAAGDRIRLFSIRGIRRSPNDGRMQAARARSWKLDLGDDIRNALLAIPGEPVARDADVGPRQVLRFAYGVERSQPEPITFRVAAGPEGGEAAVLFEETVASSRDRGRWHEAQVPLDAWAGERLEVRLETETAGPPDLARGFAAWANPEILGPPASDGPPNVLLISIDTLRADYLSSYGYPLETSPHIDAWADSAVRFRNAVAPAPWTIPSHASLFTGLEPMRHGVNHAGPVPASIETLAETLRRAGYATAAVTGGGYFRPQFGFAQGFDVYRFWGTVPSDDELVNNVERSLAWLEDHRSRRFFLFFHTYETHYPHRRRQPYFRRLDGGGPAADPPGKIVKRPGRWRPPPRWSPDTFAVKMDGGEVRKHLTEGEKALVRRMYASAVAFMDDQLQRIFRALEAHGLRERTIVVLTSDHGEMLGEDDRAGHGSLDERELMVPLIIAFPDGRGAGRVVDEQVRSIDVAPTLLDYLGLDPGYPTDGVSLLGLLSGDASALPPVAWSYAATGNFGLSLRYRNRLRYLFNNTAWAPVAGEESLRELRRPAPGNGGGERRDLAERFRELSRTTYEAQHRGLRMRIRNPGDGRLQGRLLDAWAEIARVKVADPTCRCLHWTEDGEATFSLSAGQDVTLFFEMLAGGSAGLEGTYEDPRGRRTRFEEDFDLREVGPPVFLTLSGSQWRRAPEASGPAPGFEIWRTAEADPGDGDVEVDPEAEEQLRALGYLG